MASVIQAAAFLVDRFGPGAADVQPIGRGEWSQGFAFRLGDADLIVRFGQQVEDFEKDRVAVGFAGSDLPVPRILEVGEAVGGYYALSERAFGQYLDALSLNRLKSTVPSILATLDAVRETDVSKSTGFGYWDADGIGAYARWGEALLGVTVDGTDSRQGDWRTDLVDSPTGIGPFDEAADRLRELAPRCPEVRHLIHSDLLHFNVLMADDRVAAVVDWGCAMYGDFLYDLAWLAFWSPWHPISHDRADRSSEPTWDTVDWIAAAVSHYERIGLDVPNLAERVRAYQIHIGLDSMRYNAAMGRWDNLARVTAQPVRLARATSPH